MSSNSFCFILIFLIALSSNSNEVKLIRKIEAINIPYYKISMSLGTCRENIVFTEYKAWPIVKMNRIMDIYYKSEIEYTISSVVIELVINNTDCLGFSEAGVGHTEFSATLFFADNMAVVFYSLNIFTCNRDLSDLKQDNIESQLPFYTLRKKSQD